MKEIIENFLGLGQYESLKFEIFGNSLSDFVLAAVALVTFLIVFKIVQSLVIYRLKTLAKRTKTDIDDTLIAIVQTIKPPFYSFLAFYLAATFFLSLSAFVTRFINVVLIVWIVYQTIGALQVLIDYVAKKVIGTEDDDGAKTAAGLISKIAKIALWSVGALMILSNLGVNITSLIAGLGIGGIAIAFALQGILTDLFSSFAIYFDKPFKVGDFIVVGENKGTVERIGVKSTRLRSAEGEELIISNQELTSVRIKNFRKIESRRVELELGVIYETKTELLREILKIIANIFDDMENVRLDRFHFARFDDSALVFKGIYFVDSSEHSVYMDARQEINFRIRDEFEKKDISMAYPTRTVYLAGGKNE